MPADSFSVGERSRWPAERQCLAMIGTVVKETEDIGLCEGDARRLSCFRVTKRRARHRLNCVQGGSIKLGIAGRLTDFRFGYGPVHIYDGKDDDPTLGMRSLGFNRIRQLRVFTCDGDGPGIHLARRWCSTSRNQNASAPTIRACSAQRAACALLPGDRHDP